MPCGESSSFSARLLNDCLHESSRFSSPSQYAMDIASKILEDQEYVAKLLEKSSLLLAKARSAAEDLLNEAGIGFHKKG